ncbi:hypothetical protein SDRG_05368 [Saprolegnia diclina VS20]|uniref:Uncharacterized protein n=1 Tax=Saprolegnia diclina (strain VS20) TaxID=1156394 RepID=T0QQW7_SAPDV|nr:hypothetical protein SDRG_05368 [Saprolegnia diclina VS20]EQC37141.1 hypothetical protein SDRG_05368 [Saprolegnia diclina VS20]|eukprot:XP_008609303.1 hypothetical protein SDRG_05368 [Saprolegnia diclina VS20]
MQTHKTTYGSLPLAADDAESPMCVRHKHLRAIGLVSLASLAVGAVTYTASAARAVESNDLFVVETAGENRVAPIAHAPLAASPLALNENSYIRIDSGVEYQEILGFGGAFTESAAIQFMKLPAEKREELLRLYFDPETGSAYSFGRVPMNSCDFSPGTYSFAEVPHDTNLEHFDSSVAHDNEAMIPFIRAALAKRPDMKLFLSPWSPPAWMKYPDAHGASNMLGSAAPYGLLHQYRSTWALYFSKFIDAYAGHNISFWGVTPQNEPQQHAPWEACLYDDAYQADFIGHFLGPQLRKTHPNVKLLMFDHNRGNVQMWAGAVYKHKAATQYIDGVAFHWYDNTRELDGVQNHEHVNDTHNLHPEKILLATEAANCPGVASGDDAWARGMRYAHDILGDLNNWAAGWVDWNLILDHEGGPNKLGNACDAPMILHEDGLNFTVQPMYHFIKHFSAFVPPGAKRIASDVRVTYAAPGNVTLGNQFPGGAYHCDQSANQAFERTSDNKLKVVGTMYCLDVVHEEWLGDRIEMVNCMYTQHQWSFTNASTIQFQNMCLTARYGALDNGGRLSIEPCEAGATHQAWSFHGHELRNQMTNKCVTAGYALTQAAAFKTPANDMVLVVLNENTEDAHFTLVVGDVSVPTYVPKRGIRTYRWAA